MPKKILAGVIILIFALLVSINIVYSTDFDAKLMATEFLEKVAGINLDGYTIVSLNASKNRMPDSQHFQTNVRVEISNGQVELAALVTFVDGKFWAYRLDLLSGDLGGTEQSLNESLNVISGAMDGYQINFDAGYCSGFAQMVSTALQTQSRIVEDQEALLSIHYAENGSTPLERTQVQRSQKIDGQFVSPFRSVQVSVSKTGLLTRLTDNMRLYWVATTEIKTSKEKAIEIATPLIEAYALKHQQKINAVDATLEYVTDITSDRGDRFAMYPQWTVMATFDKTNNESVFGYAVLLWADNGKVYHFGPQGFISNEGASTYPMWPFAVAIAIIVLVLSSVGTYKQRRAKIWRRSRR